MFGIIFVNERMPKIPPQTGKINDKSEENQSAVLLQAEISSVSVGKHSEHVGQLRL